MGDGEPNPRDHGYMYWEPAKMMPSHHLRSSYLFTKEAWEKAGGFPDELGGTTGFREETAFSFKILEAGFTLWTDPDAVAHHFSAQGKGRNYQGRQYPEIVAAHEGWFKKNMKPIMKKLIDKGIIANYEN